MRSVLIDQENVKRKYLLPIEQGGTGAGTQKEAIDNLGGLWIEEINKPGGVVGLDDDKHISQALIPEGTSLGVPVNLHGPQDLQLNEQGVVTITNYDSFTFYNVIYVGCEGYIHEDKIYVTVGHRQGAYIEVNGSRFALDPFGNKPLQPDILGDILEDTFTSTPGRKGFGSIAKMLEGGGMVVSSPSTNISGKMNVGVIDYTVQSNLIREFLPTLDVIGSDGNIYFGEVFDSTNYLNKDTLVVGVKRVGSTGRSRVEFYENFKEAFPSKTFQEAPDGHGTLSSVVISRDASTVAVGYPEAENYKGAVVIYKKSGTGYTFVSSVRDIENTDNDLAFGANVALGLDGKLLAVVSKRLPEIILFRINSIVTEEGRISLPEDTREVTSINLSEDNNRLTIGVFTMMNKGAVLVYFNSPSGWVLKATLMQPDTIPYEAGFGTVVSCSKDLSVIAIGAPGGPTMIGRVYLFFNGTVSFEHYKTLGELESNLGDRFGESLSMSPEGNQLWVGVPGDNKVLVYGGLFEYLS